MCAPLFSRNISIFTNFLKQTFVRTLLLFDDNSTIFRCASLNAITFILCGSHFLYSVNASRGVIFFFFHACSNRQQRMFVLSGVNVHDDPRTEIRVRFVNRVTDHIFMCCWSHGRSFASRTCLIERILTENLPT